MLEWRSMEPLDHSHSVKHITVLWLGRIGDLIVSTPALRAIRRRYPKARIRLVLSGLCEGLAPLLPFHDEVVFARRVHHPVANMRLAAGLIAGDCDLLIDLNPSASRISAALAAMIRAPVKIGFAKGRLDSAYTHRMDPPGEKEHMLDRYARLALLLETPYEPRLEVVLPDGTDGQAAALVTPSSGFSILIHPGNFKKKEHRWSEENFIALTNRLLDEEALTIRYLAGPGESKKVQAIVSRLKRPVPVLGPLPLALTAGLIKRTDLCVFNVTGTLHLAAAVGTPTFTFHSGYTAEVWKPRGPRHTGCVSPVWDSCREIPLEDAQARLLSFLGNLKKNHSK